MKSISREKKINFLTFKKYAILNMNILPNFYKFLIKLKKF